MFIYLIVNHETGKYYVGQHKGNNLKKYLQKKFSDARHNHGGKSRLYNSMRTHPFPHLWSIHALRADIQTREELDETERDFIKFLRSQDPEYGYNICRGGEGRTGPLNPENRLKLLKAQRKRWSDPQAHIQQSEKIKMMWKIPGHRETVIAKNTGQRRSPEIKAKLAKILENARKFLPVEQSEKSNKKRSMALLGKPKPESFGVRISQKLSGRAIPNAVREKISQTLKNRIQTPEALAKNLANLEKGRAIWAATERVKKPSTPCSIQDCEKPIKAHGLCNTHLQRKYRHGNPLAEIPNRGIGGPVRGTFHHSEEARERIRLTVTKFRNELGNKMTN